MTRKEINTNSGVVECAVCGRTLLRGERPEVYLDGPHRLAVCELCSWRAKQAGWVREDAAPDVAPGPRDKPRRRSLLARLGLRSAGSAREMDPGLRRRALLRRGRRGRELAEPEAYPYDPLIGDPAVEPPAAAPPAEHGMAEPSAGLESDRGGAAWTGEEALADDRLAFDVPAEAGGMPHAVPAAGFQNEEAASARGASAEQESGEPAPDADALEGRPRPYGRRSGADRGSSPGDRAAARPARPRPRPRLRRAAAERRAEELAHREEVAPEALAGEASEVAPGPSVAPAAEPAPGEPGGPRTESHIPPAGGAAPTSHPFAPESTEPGAVAPQAWRSGRPERDEHEPAGAEGSQAWSGGQTGAVAEPGGVTDGLAEESAGAQRYGRVAGEEASEWLDETSPAVVEPPTPTSRRDPGVRRTERHPYPEPVGERHIHAIPSTVGGRLARALELFNLSDHPRTVAGIARSLGAPLVAARVLDAHPSVISVVVAWELCWYRYEVDLVDESGAVRLVEQGDELNELDVADQRPNASADERGMLMPMSA